MLVGLMADGGRWDLVLCDVSADDSGGREGWWWWGRVCKGTTAQDANRVLTEATLYQSTVTWLLPSPHV